MKSLWRYTVQKKEKRQKEWVFCVVSGWLCFWVNIRSKSIIFYYTWNACLIFTPPFSIFCGKTVQDSNEVTHVFSMYCSSCDAFSLLSLYFPAWQPFFDACFGEKIIIPAEMIVFRYSLHIIHCLKSSALRYECETRWGKERKEKLALKQVKVM